MTKIFWYLGHEQFQPEVLVEQAKAAEAAGFDGVMVSEHFHPWVDDVGAGGFAYATLGAIAQATSNVELMTAVTTPLWRYHPAIVAQAAATIDRLSGGRFYLGVGTGENINEGPLGYHFPAYAERAARMKEALEIMHRLLAGEKLDYQGTYYETASAKLYSPPVHPVPIYLAAGGPKSAALAGESADGVIISVKSAEDARNQVIDPAAASAQSLKRPRPAIVTSHWTVRGQTEEEVWQALRPWRGLRAPSRLRAIDPAALQKEADELPRSDILSRYTQVKTASDYLDVYGEIIRQVKPDILGIQTTSVDQLETIQLVGRDVVPKLREIS